jgi:hypothetical protein
MLAKGVEREYTEHVIGPDTEGEFKDGSEQFWMARPPETRG